MDLSKSCLLGECVSPWLAVVRFLQDRDIFGDKESLSIMDVERVVVGIWRSLSVPVIALELDGDMKSPSIGNVSLKLENGWRSSSLDDVFRAYVDMSSDLEVTAELGYLGYSSQELP